MLSSRSPAFMKASGSFMTGLTVGFCGLGKTFLITNRLCLPLSGFRLFSCKPTNLVTDVNIYRSSHIPI